MEELPLLKWLKRNRFRNELLRLYKTRTNKPYYAERKCNVFKNAKILYMGVIELYQAFEDKIAKNKSEGKSEDKQPLITDMPPLEPEEEAARRIENQGKGLKILTPQQMLTRLPISLA